MVAHHLAKVRVAGSNPVFRSKYVRPDLGKRIWARNLAPSSCPYLSILNRCGAISSALNLLTFSSRSPMTCNALRAIWFACAVSPRRISASAQSRRPRASHGGVCIISCSRSARANHPFASSKEPSASESNPR